MSLVDTNDVNDLAIIHVAMATPNNLNSIVRKHEICPLEESRDQYNREVVFLTSKMAEVSGHLALLNKMQTELSRAAWQSSNTLGNIQKSLAARPPAQPPGTVFPLDIDVEMIRPTNRPSQNMHIDGALEVILAHCIPQCRSKDIIYDQIVPTDYLKGLGMPLTGKNGCQLYSSTHGRRNIRAMARLQNGTGETYGDTLWIPRPLETEKWFSLIVDKPSNDVETSIKLLRNQSIYRFTIDTLFDGRHLLSFAKENDQLMAKMVL